MYLIILLDFVVYEIVFNPNAILLDFNLYDNDFPFPLIFLIGYENMSFHLPFQSKATFSFSPFSF